MNQEEAELYPGLAKAVELIKELAKTKKFVIVGVAGGSCSGKGYFSDFLASKVGAKILSMDSYYFGIDKLLDMNFDKPAALDLNLIKEQLRILKKGDKVKKPIYDFATHSRTGFEEYFPGKIIILEGLFALNNIFVDELDLKIFVTAFKDTRFKRRLDRDVAERGRTKESVIAQWNETVQPMYMEFVRAQKEFADLIILNDKENKNN